MTDQTAPRARPPDEFTPKLVTVLREGYGFADFRADAIAGLTVAIVALPLSMAIAIASGLSPDKGLYTAIAGGFIISALGGSRFQVGGPAGAFIVLVYSIVERHGYGGLALATMMAGVIMIAAGYLRFGDYIKYIPYPVTVGFTAGIAVIIFASQLRELLGLEIAKEPAAFLPKLAVLWDAITTIRPMAIVLSALGIAIILGLRKWRPDWPGFLIAVAVCAALTFGLQLDVATIGSRFGGMASGLPAPSLPEFTLAKMAAVFPDALAIALLGSIESLLSAVVADGMSGRRHRSNCELVAQGIGNIGAIIFGGMPVTGTIARTATNVRSGSRGPVSGMLHAIYVLLFMILAAPLAFHIPLAALGAVLAIVAWNMAEKREFAMLMRSRRGDATVLMATFLLTVFADLTIGIAVGVTLGAFIFLHRMAGSFQMQTADAEETNGAGEIAARADPEIMVYKISGAFFFGATASASAVLDRIGRYPRALVFDFSEVPLMDSSAAKTLEPFVHKLTRECVFVFAAAARPDVRQALMMSGLRPPLVHFAASVNEAREQARRMIEKAGQPGVALR